MIYHRPIQIEFNHCDPAGIVFYPRYFEMTNSVAENFFRDIVGHSYAAMMAAAQGVPTARLEADFHAASRLGETLDWQLSVTRLGQSSVSLTLEAWCDGEKRVTVRLVLVFAGAQNGKPASQPWPPALRQRLAAFMAQPANAP
ncbi:acyl-CoA thioesterase [Pseudotabrizicola sp. L79]|uniref:acyl-CoA thioesterase n=1 Tax=Pseudotabrizicola sp. L79 TaxID=3118402 RepID=UPI002F92307D